MPEEQQRRLDSWKEIAEYLRHDVRTVIRWEKDKGLPVHRLPGRHRSSVFAFSHEIDAWMGDGFSKSHLIDSSMPAPPIAAGHRISAPPSSKPWPVIRWMIVALAALAVASAVFIFFWTRPGPPMSVTSSGSSIRVWDGKGRLVWEYEFPRLLSEAKTVLGDRDGDGRNDFAAVVPLYMGHDQTESSELYCFDGRGRLLWRYSPNFTLSSGSRRFAAPWIMAAMTSAPRSKSVYIWIAYNQVLWWPGGLVRLDMEGRASLRFVNAGWITALESFENAAGNWILAGGINNQHDQAMLAVIKEDAPESASPYMEGSAYVLDDAPRENPHRYFLFPRSELNLATNHPVNNANDIGPRPSEIEVRTDETAVADLAGRGIYLFSPQFDLTDISRTDTYWDLHRKLEKEGVLKHAAEQCPERKAPTIRGWNPEEGWIMIRPKSFPAAR